MPAACQWKTLACPHQWVGVIALHGTVVHDVSLEDNEEEEEAQHDVAQVAQDVVERAARVTKVTRVTFIFSLMSRAGQGRAGRWGQRVNLPEGSQRVRAQEVVEADVLVSSDVDHLEKKGFTSEEKPQEVWLSVSPLEGCGFVESWALMDSLFMKGFLLLFIFMEKVFGILQETSIMYLVVLWAEVSWIWTDPTFWLGEVTIGSNGSTVLNSVESTELLWDAGIAYRLVGDDQLDDRQGVEDSDGGDVPEVRETVIRVYLPVGIYVMSVSK